VPGAFGHLHFASELAIRAFSLRDHVCSSNAACAQASSLCRINGSRFSHFCDAAAFFFNAATSTMASNPAFKRI
jgi:hypothetical protein